MKSKKLFAILTLMAFMMTLLPMAAFAADANHHSSSLSVEEETADADFKDTAELKVYLFDSSGVAVKDKTDIYVFSERGALDKIYYDDLDDLTKPATLIDKNGDPTSENSTGDATPVAYKIPDIATGKVEIGIVSSVVGSPKIAVALSDGTAATNLKEYWDDTDKANTYRVIGAPEVIFESAEAGNIVLSGIEGKGSNEGKITETDGSNKTDQAITFQDEDSKAKTAKANGIDYYDLTFKVTTSSTKDIPVKDEEVEFSCSDSDVRFSDETDDTDNFGEASTKIYATEAGVYKINVECGDKDKDFYVVFGPADLQTLEIASAPDPKIALDESKASVKLRFFDAQGQEIEVTDKNMGDIFDGTPDGSGDDLDIDVITAPDDKDEEDFEYERSVSDGLLKIKISDKNKKCFEEEGRYEFKLSLESGKYVTVKFDVVEQGDIVRLGLEYDQSNLPLEGKSSTPTVKRYDADDVSVELDDTDLSDITFSVNKLAILDKNHRDINEEATEKDTNGNDVTVREKGQLIITDDDDYVEEELVVTAVDTDNDLTASYTFAIGNAVNGLEITEGAAEVGKDAEVTVQLVDEKGNKVAFGDEVTDVSFDSYIVSKPTGANVSCDEASGFSTDLKEDGFSTVDIKSNKAGKVKVQFVVKADGVAYTAVATANFGAAIDDTLGANAVTMFIGNTGYVQDGAVKTTDVAPFINPENNRTYVAVRALGDAFGAKADWDNTTKTATFTRSDMVVSITIGSNVITKVADGVTTTTEIDAPAFIKEGRTVLPFRAVGEAFGYKVGYDATNKAVSFTK